jgi:acetyl esterase/lipase
MYALFNVTDPTCSETAISSDLSARVKFQKEQYGSHPDEVAQVMVKEEVVGRKDLPLFLFLHGGAWGSGFGTMYRLIAAPFIKQNHRAIVLNYRTYPDASMEEQMDDLTRAVDYFKAKYTSTGSLSASSPMILMGHSSGAHIAMMAMLRGKLASSVDALIGMSGVYNLELAHEFEQERGLTDLSPMSPASNGRFQEFSPTWLLNNCDLDSLSSLPPLLLIHGEDDPVAPLFYSQELHLLLTEKHRLNCHLEILENVQHQDTVLHTSLGKGRVRSIIFEWLENLYVERL